MKFGFTGHLSKLHRSLFVPRSSWLVGAKILQKMCGRTLLGRALALSGSVGCRGFAHNVQRLECSGEVLAARRALLLPQTEGTGNGAGR